MRHLTSWELQLRQALGPLSAQSEHHLTFCRRCQAQAAAVQQAVEQIEATKRHLGWAMAHFLGTLETRLTSDRTALLRYRPPGTLFERSPAWESRVEIAVGLQRLEMYAVSLEAGLLFYVRVSTRALEAPPSEKEAFVARPGLELMLISADGAVRSATTSRQGQAIFHLAPGVFALLLPPPKGGELRVVWYP